VSTIMNNTDDVVCDACESLSRSLGLYHPLFCCAMLCGRATLIPYGVVVLRYTFMIINLSVNLIQPSVETAGYLERQTW